MSIILDFLFLKKRKKILISRKDTIPPMWKVLGIYISMRLHHLTSPGWKIHLWISLNLAHVLLLKKKIRKEI